MIPAVERTPGTNEKMATEWYYQIMNDVVGPLSGRQLLDKVRAGQVKEDTLVRKDDSQWVPARQVNGLMDAVEQSRTQRVCPYCGQPVDPPPSTCRGCSRKLALSFNSRLTAMSKDRTKVRKIARDRAAEAEVIRERSDRADIVRITRGFDPAIPHYGIDYSCLVGRPVYAACDGMARVLTDTAANGGFGRYVRIETPNYRVYTAHLSEWLVDDGAQVRAGLRIGLSGNTGNSTGPHLHFEVRRNAGSSHLHGAIDPEPLIVWAVDEPPVAEPYLPTNDPFTQAASTEKERYTKIRWWIEERRRQYEAGAIAYADQIDAALIEQMYTWEGSLT